MKRIADWLEKISAGSILIGLYQNNMWAITIGFFTYLHNEEIFMTAAWIATVIICVGAFLYAVHLGKQKERK